MAKKVVLAQGGSIIFDSKEGKGSTFGFLFPKSTALKVKPLPVAATQTEAK
jgi:signal transduction histidine kinase